MDKLKVLKEIKNFLDGYNDDLKYLVNVEIDTSTNLADCVIHEPNSEKKIIKVPYEPFIYMKDLKKLGLSLYNGNQLVYNEKLKQHGITIHKLLTNNFKRLSDGFCYKITSSKSMNNIMEFLGGSGMHPYGKTYDNNGNPIRDENGEILYKNKDHFYKISNQEQFFISTKSRLYKGIEDYKDIHKVTFDIETTGLRYAVSRLFAIGIRDNRGFEKIIELEKQDDDESERLMIIEFYETLINLNPAIVCGYNSEEFDFGFIDGRAKILKLNLNLHKTTLKNGVKYNRKPNVSVKFGGKSLKYTATEIWGMSCIDIMHAAKRTQAINNEIKDVKLKNIASFENIAKPNRTYINGKDNFISKIYKENKIYVVDSENNYMVIPEELQEVSRILYLVQCNKSNLTEIQYKTTKTNILNKNINFVDWFRAEAKPKQMNTLISGKKLLKQYLLDDLWETEKVDELYNQSSFMLAKIIPTTYQRICTMGTAAVWNLLMTAWSYEKNIAIPCIETKETFSGGLARTFRKGFSKDFVKIDFSGLYPAIELTENSFPMFDFTSGLKKMLLYSTTTRNIYKRLANKDNLNENELLLLKEIDHETYNKLITNTISDKDRAMFKVKQLPLKILNNSQFGALGSGIALNWSDSICAARITCVGRLLLRKSIKWFENYGCTPLLAVTDGINCIIPKTSNIILGVGENTISETEIPISEAWQYNGLIGVSALIDKYNKEVLANYRSERVNSESYLMVDDDGQFTACINLSKINYATLSKVKNKKTGLLVDKVKLTGNTIKSKSMSEYIEDFIGSGFELLLHNKGKEFVELYYQYVNDIIYRKIPLKKIARKDKINKTIETYVNRGNNKNGQKKGMQGFMECMIDLRNENIETTFQKHKHELTLNKLEEKLKLEDKFKLIKNLMPKEPELDSYVYTINIGEKYNDPDSKRVVDENGKKRLLSVLFIEEDFEDKPNLVVNYNIKKYLNAFNSRVEKILVAFEDKVADKILAKFKKVKVVGVDGKKYTEEQLIINDFFENSDYELKNFELDNIEESMILEKKEVDFWNKYGYNPYLVWDGFKTEKGLKTEIRYDVYSDALKYLNDKMLAVDKPLIKSLDDNLDIDDMVLMKNRFNYSLGVFNGEYINIIRENLDIPKSQYQSDLELLEKLELETIDNLKKKAKKKTSKENTEEESEESEDEIKIKHTRKLRKYLADFLIKYNVEEDITLEMIYSDIVAKSMFDEYISDIENEYEYDDEDSEYDD